MPRLEDPALVTGRGRFVADLAAGAAALRFVRSPIALWPHRRDRAGRAARTVLTAADLAGVRPIRPLLHRPDYVPSSSRSLRPIGSRYVGEPIAAVIAASAAEAEDLAEQVVVDIEPEDAVVDVDAALAPGAPLVHPQAAGNVLVEGGSTPASAAAFARAAEVVEIDDPLAPAERAAAGGARRARRLRCGAPAG